MKVYIVHGYGANPKKHWFPDLAKNLAQLGVECHCIAMPNTENPNVEQWLNALQPLSVDEKTIFVGHSLGCIAILNFLARGYHQPKAVILVSGFYQPLANLPELTPFSNAYAVSPPLMPFKSYVISAFDDTVVAHQYSDQLAQHLNADYIRLPTGGHFLESEGWIHFPLVLHLIKQEFAL